jgi:hypothetical protein
MSVYLCVCWTDVQGSADDEEVWAALGGAQLTPAIFWQHHAAILEADCSACTNLVESIVNDNSKKTEPSAANNNSKPFAWVRKNRENTAGVAVGGMRAGQAPECWLHFDAVINVSPEESAGMPPPVGNYK